MATKAEIDFFGVTVSCSSDGYPSEQLSVIIDWWMKHQELVQKTIDEYEAAWAILGPEVTGYYNDYFEGSHTGFVSYTYRVDEKGIHVKPWDKKRFKLVLTSEEIAKIAVEQKGKFRHGFDDELEEWLEKKLPR